MEGNRGAMYLRWEKTSKNKTPERERREGRNRYRWKNLSISGSDE